MIVTKRVPDLGGILLRPPYRKNPHISSWQIDINTNKYTNSLELKDYLSRLAECLFHDEEVLREFMILYRGATGNTHSTGVARNLQKGYMHLQRKNDWVRFKGPVPCPFADYSIEQAMLPAEDWRNPMLFPYIRTTSARKAVEIFGHAENKTRNKQTGVRDVEAPAHLHMSVTVVHYTLLTIDRDNFKTAVARCWERITEHPLRSNFAIYIKTDNPNRQNYRTAIYIPKDVPDDDEEDENRNSPPGSPGGHEPPGVFPSRTPNLTLTLTRAGYEEGKTRSKLGKIRIEKKKIVTIPRGKK